MAILSTNVASRKAILIMSRIQGDRSSRNSQKEPWLAVNLSMLYPGIGQIYAGYPVKGWILIIFQVILACFGIGLLLSSIANIFIPIIILLIFYILFFIWNLFDAYYSTKNRNERSFEAERKRQKDPWLAVFLTRIIPGIGYLYIGKTILGIILIILWLIFSLHKILNLIFTLFLPFIIYHVYHISPVKRESSQKLIKTLAIYFLIIPILMGAISAFTIRTFIAEARYIPSSTMEPTLQIRDRLIVEKWSYRFQAPQRGDIVVFNPTEPLKKQNFHDAFIKRIIGLPGETVEVKGSKVYINNQPLAENYIAELPNYKYGSVKVPKDSYFVLGDNRNNSYDSHYWGFVPKEYIIGKASKIFWPPERNGNIK